jgi:hypothetical protein
MDASRRDATDEWVLPEHSSPPSVKELEGRIDVAMSRARSAEAAASAIGAAALDAAEQARRSAEAAERTHKLAGERLGPREPQDPFAPAVPSPLAAPSPPSGLDSSDSPVTTTFPAAGTPAFNGPGGAEEAHLQVQARGEDPMRAFVARADRISLRLQRLQSAPPAASP